MFDEVKPARHLEIQRFIATHGSPIVYTTGSGVAEANEIFTEGRKICEILDVPGIFVGSPASNSLLGGTERFLHIDYIDFETLLPQCLAIIHHGGIGTTAQAIKAGIPQIIRPMTFDQPDNGYRIFLLGLGFSVSPKKFTAKRVSAALTAILRTLPKSAQFAKYAFELKRGGAIERACDLIDATLCKSTT
jgi:UDP:flavonoid glycosyltransferase YjiC (YdhE family)